MDIDKTRKPKKEKPYVLIFVVLAALYLIWALIFGVALKGRASEIDHVVDCYIANSNVLFFTDPESVVSSRYDAAASSDDLESFYNSAFLRLEFPDSPESQEIYATRLREALQVLYAQYPDGNIIIALHDYYATAAVYQLVYNTCEQVGLLINVGSYISNYADWNLIYINCFYETVTAWTRDLSNPTSTLTPTPTTAPVTYFDFLIDFDRYNSHSYALVSVECSGLGTSVDLSSDTSNLYSAIINNTSARSPAFKSSFVVRNGVYFNESSMSRESGVFVYFSAESVSSVSVYNLGSALVSSDYDYIKQHYTSSSVPLKSNTNSDTRLCYFQDSVYPKLFAFRWIPSGGYGDTVFLSSNASESSVQSFTASGEVVVYPFPWSLSLTNIYSFYGISGMMSDGGIAPTPDPNATPTPSPQPTPTDMPQVIIHLPSGTPTPTAPVSFSPGDLPGSGGSAGGSGGSGLSGSELNSVLSFFKARLQNNQAIAFIAESFNVLPAELLWYFGFAIVIGICVRILWIFIFAKEG